MGTIKVVDFAKVPGLRHSRISEKSGEEYYHQVLNQAFAEAVRDGECLTVILDGTRGFPPSFLDEAFGNLVYDFSLAQVKKTLQLVSDVEPHWIPYIEKKFGEWEGRRVAEKPPRIVTEAHEPWFRLDRDELKRDEWTKP